jgi:hypothetical protein
LTKADLVEEGDFPQWSKVLNNERYILRRGYYATRLPGSSTKDLKLSWEEARNQEKSVFGREPWKQCRDRKRLGIENLTEALSSGLAELIDSRCSRIIIELTDFSRLPSLRMQLTNMAAEIQQSLEDLPLSFSEEPQTKLLALCNRFVSELGEHINGTTRHPEFLSKLYEHFGKLSHQIRGTRPDFNVTKSSTLPHLTQCPSAFGQIEVPESLAPPTFTSVTEPFDIRAIPKTEAAPRKPSLTTEGNDIFSSLALIGQLFV